jgi:hypothetical protein
MDATLQAAIRSAIDLPAWRAAPTADDPMFDRTYRQLSVALQIYLRKWLSQEWFSQTGFEIRKAVAPAIVYRASRIHYGRQNGFTRDMAHPSTLAACEVIGKSIQRILAEIQHHCSPELRVRYHPKFAEDVRREALVKPRDILNLFATESAVIEAVIRLASEKRPVADRVEKCLRRSLLSVRGHNMSAIAPKAIDAGTFSLTLSMSEMLAGDDGVPLRPLVAGF